LQLGLFSSMGNAEKLVKELKAKGIEAHTETRVQLGPFKNRAEADEAMAKLRSLGYTRCWRPPDNKFPAHRPAIQQGGLFVCQKKAAKAA
jgi:cell division septation protein DedD